MQERKIRVLLVEDLEEDAQAILAVLATGGFSVVSQRVETAAQLRSALRTPDWSVVLSDFSLARFSAMEALEILRHAGAQVPMVVVTGAIGEEAAAAVIKAGATDLVTKQGLRRLIPVIERNLRELESARQHAATLAALHESEARFRAIAGNLPGAVYQGVVHRDGRVEFAYVSEGSHFVLGVTAQTLMSRPETILDMMLPEDRAIFLAMRIQSATNLTPLNWEGRVRVGADGQEIKWINVRASVRKLPSGTIISDGIISSINESKQAQSAIEAQRQQLRQLTSHIEHVKEEERAHVAREIHDDLGGTLTAAKIDLAWIRRRLGNNQAALAAKADAMEALLNSAIEATGRISRDLRPLVLDFGVAAAIEWQVKEFRKRMGVTCNFTCAPEDILLDRQYSTALFRVFQETLINIAKHAGASRVDVSLEDDGSTVLLTVMDNGQGIELGDMRKNGSYGIRGMRERVDFLGGSIDISSTRGAGTKVLVCLPAKRPPGEAQIGEAALHPLPQTLPTLSQ